MSCHAMKKNSTHLWRQDASVCKSEFKSKSIVHISIYIFKGKGKEGTSQDTGDLCTSENESIAPDWTVCALRNSSIRFNSIHSPHECFFHTTFFISKDASSSSHSRAHSSTQVVVVVDPSFFVLSALHLYNSIERRMGFILTLKRYNWTAISSG